MSPIYLQEEPQVVLGMEAAYAAAVKDVIYPLVGADKPGMRLCPVGAFRNDTAFDPSWTTFTFLWSYTSWQAYAQDRQPATQRETAQLMTEAYESHPGLAEYIRTAGKYRTRSNERLLAPVDFSPLPQPQPARTSPNAMVVRQQFTLEKPGGRGFLEQFSTSVLPAAKEIGHPRPFHLR